MWSDSAIIESALLNANFVSTNIVLCLQTTIDIMHIGRLYVGSETLSLLVAAQCLLLWFRLQFFIR